MSCDKILLEFGGGTETVYSVGAGTIEEDVIGNGGGRVSCSIVLI
jgi:hypothetical protein